MRSTFLLVCTLLVSEFAVAASAEVSQDRAHHLAAAYFARYFAEGCGGAGVPSLRGDYWEAPVHIGAAGTLNGFIRIQRRTGTVSDSQPFRFHPTVSAESLDRWSESLRKRAHKP